MVVPTNRPDVRAAPYGIDDVIEEVARTFGYANIPRHTPTWPQPGGLNARQRSRRRVKEVLCGIGASEGWTNSFVSEDDHRRVGLTGPAVRVSNPLDAAEPFLRRSLMPGLLGALAYNAGRRRGTSGSTKSGRCSLIPTKGLRVVERSGAGGAQTAVLPGERELLAAVLAQDDDDARSAVVAWRVLLDAVQGTGVHLVAPTTGARALPGSAPDQIGSARGPGRGQMTAPAGSSAPWAKSTWRSLCAFGLIRNHGRHGASPAGSAGSRSMLGLALRRDRGALRQATLGAAVSRFPSSRYRPGPSGRPTTTCSAELALAEVP